MVKRNKYEKRIVDWMIAVGWESNGKPGILERWRRRTFDHFYNWVTLNEAVKKQRKWDKFWGKK